VNYLTLQAKYEGLDRNHQDMLINGTKLKTISRGSDRKPVDKVELEKNLKALENKIHFFARQGYFDIELQFGMDRCILIDGDSKIRHWYVAFRFLAKLMNATLFDCSAGGAPVRADQTLKDGLKQKGCKSILVLIGRDTSRSEKSYGFNISPVQRGKQAIDAANNITTWPDHCVVMVGDTPYMNRTTARGTLPRICLSDHVTKNTSLEDCHSFTNRSKPWLDDWMRSSLSPDVTYFSMNDILCDDVFCYANDGSYPLYIEDHHISSFAATLYTDEFISRVQKAPCYKGWAATGT